jgi:phosphate transport system permease protein
MATEVPFEVLEEAPPTIRYSLDRNLGDRAFRWLTTMMGLGGLVTLAAIFGLLAWDSRQVLARFGVGFVFGTVWDPVFEDFGALPFVYGTVVTSVVALVLAVPVAIGAAVFVVEYAPSWLKEPVSFTVEMLAAIPSIIYGLWGFFVLAPVMRDVLEPALQALLGPLPLLGLLVSGTPLGKDLLTGGVILAIMILPIVMSISREVIRVVPQDQREAMLALGATKWETIWYVVLPYARSGLLGAAMLDLARAFGETMAVTMVVGNSTTEISPSLFTPGYTLASAIANQFTEADKEIYFSALVGLALVLLLVSALINIAARLLVARLGRSTALSWRAR